MSSPESMSNVELLESLSNFSTTGPEIDLSRLRGADALASATPDVLTQLELEASRALFGEGSACSLIYTGGCGRFRMMSQGRADAYRRERAEEFQAHRSLSKPSQFRTPIDPILENACVVHGIGIPHFADSVAERLGLPLVEVDYTTFANSEIAPRIKERVEGKDVFLIQRIPAPVNEYIMSVALTIDALTNGAGARSVTLVVPYYPYGRQDERREGVQSSLSNEVAAKLLSPSIAGLITVDIHSPKTSEYFPQGFYNVIPYSALVPELVQRFGGERIVAVSPDAGGMSRSDQGSLPRALIEAFGDDVSFASCDKKRDGPNKVKEMVLPAKYLNDIQGRTALLFDDMLDTGGTIASAATLLKQAGALKVVVVTTHPIASRGALERFEGLMIEQEGKPVRLIDEIVTTDTLPLSSAKGEFISTISVAPLLAETILEAQRDNVESRREEREALVAPVKNDPLVTV